MGGREGKRPAPYPPNIEGRLRTHILPAFGSVALGVITPADVRAWVAELSSKGLAPSTVKATYLTFGQIVRTAEIDGLIRRSPCLGIELPADNSRAEMHFLTAAQVAALAGSINDRYRCLIITAAYTGMRARELGALKLERVNCSNGLWLWSSPWERFGECLRPGRRKRASGARSASRAS